MDCGIRLAADTMSESEYFNPDVRQSIILFTMADVYPDCVWDEIIGSYNASPSNYSAGKASAENATEYLKSNLSLQEWQDEINVVVINNDPDPIEEVQNIPWFNNSMVWPNPYIWNPIWDETNQSFSSTSQPGWVTYINEQKNKEVTARIAAIVASLLSGIELGVEIIDSTTIDPNPDNDYTMILLHPYITT
jgi:hypothetical protein